MGGELEGVICEQDGGRVVLGWESLGWGVRAGNVVASQCAALGGVRERERSTARLAAHDVRTRREGLGWMVRR